MAQFVPPPYPFEFLDSLRSVAEASTFEIVDCSIGTPCDPLPEVARSAILEALGAARGYPASIGSASFRGSAAGWIARRFGVELAPSQVAACVGTKEFVATLPQFLSLRDPSRDTVLYPAISYPTYAMGAQLAGLRSIPVPLDSQWHVDLAQVSVDDARRTLVLWLNEPSNPTGSQASSEYFRGAVQWARERGIVVASDECYAEFSSMDSGAAPNPTTVLSSGTEGVIAVHSLSKRSNMAGLRIGFYAGDAGLVSYLSEVRKHAGFMVPGPVQAAGAAALLDDVHVDEQRDRYIKRRDVAIQMLGDVGIAHVGGRATFYLWLRDNNASSEVGDPGWALCERLAGAGILGAPGNLYGPGGVEFARLALVQPFDALTRALGRLQEIEHR